MSINWHHFRQMQRPGARVMFPKVGTASNKDMYAFTN
jgi:hypothetical protein